MYLFVVVAHSYIDYFKLNASSFQTHPVTFRDDTPDVMLFLAVGMANVFGFD